MKFRPMTFSLAAAFAAILLAPSPPSALAAGPGRWAKAAPMPDERSEVALAALGGKIYLAGGFGDSGNLLVYDPAAGRWENGRPFPGPFITRAPRRRAGASTSWEATGGAGARSPMCSSTIRAWTAGGSGRRFPPRGGRWPSPS